MRLKQQTFVDKYIEKIVLAVALLISLAIVYFFVLGTPYSVEIKPGQKATPEEVEQNYLQQANRLKMAVQRTEPPEQISGLKIPDYVGRFKARYEQRLVSSDTLFGIVFGPPGLAGTGPGGGGETKILDVALVPPLPAKDLTTQVGYYVLDADVALLAAMTDLARAQNPNEKEDAIRKIATDWSRQAIDLAGKQDPRDFWGVSVQATINPQDWLDEFAKVPAERRTPETWYKDMAEFISAIELQRQTMDPKTGQWPADDKFETIAPLPGAVANILQSYIKQVQEAKTGTAKLEDDEAADLQQALLENLRFYLPDLAKPQFLPTKAHRPWQEPGVVPPELSPADQQTLLKLNQQITKYESELRALVGRSSTVDPTTGGSTTIPPRITSPYGEEGRLKTPPGKGPPQPKGKLPVPGVDPAKKANPTEDRINLYKSRLADLNKQRDEILSKLRKDDTPVTDPTDPRATIRRPGDTRTEIFPEGIRPGTPGTPGTQPRRPGDPLRPPVGGEEAEVYKLPPIKVWAHDASVQPGMTYRYRVVYRVINPLFNKEDQLVAPLKPKALELESASIPSAWTSAVAIESPLRYFVEDVKPETSTVTFGVYRIHNGYRIHKQFATRPGDPIGRTTEVEVKDDTGAPAGKAEVDLSVPLVLVDLKTPPKQAGAIGVRGPMTVLVADLLEGNVSMRDPASDRTDPDRVRLFNEATGALAVIPAAGANDPRLQPDLRFPAPPPGEGPFEGTKAPR